MGGSASTYASAPPGVPVPAETVARRNDGRLVPMLFLGGILAMYAVVGYAIYAVIGVLT